MRVKQCGNLGRRVGGEGFPDIETNDIIELIDSYDYSLLSVHDLMEMSQAKKNGDGNEEDEVELMMKELTGKNSTILQVCRFPGTGCNGHGP